MSDEKDFVIFVGNLAEKVTDTLLHELFLQAGPIEDVTVKKGFGFITFTHHESVPYTIRLFEGIQLFGKKLVMKPRDGSMYANMTNDRGKDIRRSRSMNDFPQQAIHSMHGSRDNRSQHFGQTKEHNIKKIPSLNEIESLKSGGRPNAGFNNSWSAGSMDQQIDQRGFDRSLSYNPSGSANGSFNSDTSLSGEDYRRKMDNRGSFRNGNSPYDRSGMQNNSFGNRSFKNSPSRADSGNAREFETRHSTPNRRDSQYDRNAYYEKKNFNPSRSFDSQPHQDNWGRNSGNYGSPSTPGSYPSRFDTGPHRSYHDKSYNREQSQKYGGEDYSKGNFHYGNSGRRH